MKIAVIVMIKDEVELLEAWLSYHSYIFGAESLFIFDNGSTNLKTRTILSDWHIRLGGLDVSHSTSEDFRDKGDIFLKKIRALEDDGFDCFFPLDCDEFIAVDYFGNISTNAENIKCELNMFRLERRILGIKYALDNSPLLNFKYTKSPQKKCFFMGGVCSSLDHGFHDAKSFDNNLNCVETNIIYIHYHFRLYRDYVRAARDKLGPWIKNFDKKQLVDYRNAKKPGFHLIDKIISEPEIYYLEQRARFSGVDVVEVESFMKFMSARNLLVNIDLVLAAYISDEVGWQAHIDTCILVDSRLLINGWAFNEGGLQLGSVRLKFSNFISEPLIIHEQARPDVGRVHGSAPLFCGFSFACPVREIDDLVGLSVLFSSSKAILGHLMAIKVNFPSK